MREGGLNLEVVAWEVLVVFGGLCADLGGSTGLGWGLGENTISPQAHLF